MDNRLPISPTPTVRSIAQTQAIRRANLVALRQQFMQIRLQTGGPLTGVRGAFAEVLGLSGSRLSQVLSTRPIGNTLARRIETRCDMPPGWLDQDHAQAPSSADDAAYLKLAFKAWQLADAAQRSALQQASSAVIQAADAQEADDAA